MTVLETERLTLRPHRLSDFEDYAAMLASERSVPMGGPVDRGTAWDAFCGEVAAAQLGLGQVWAIERRADEAHVGQVGFQQPPSFPERELGWMLYAGFEGQGYALEAARAARDYGFGTLGWDDFVSYIDPDNARSVRLAEALGGVRDADAPVPTEGDLVYRHTRPEVSPA
ncbi:MAG: GNAT family N-acetyltransferase [Pseudomonadota bacterium]